MPSISLYPIKVAHELERTRGVGRKESVAVAIQVNLNLMGLAQFEGHIWVQEFKILNGLIPSLISVGLIGDKLYKSNPCEPAGGFEFLHKYRDF